jgi:hypothetical protein
VGGRPRPPARGRPRPPASFKRFSLEYDSKPGSVIRACAQEMVIPLGRPLPDGSSDRLGAWIRRGQRRRVSPRPLFGLAPDGVYRAPPVTGRAVRFYRTVSPLPPRGRSNAGAVCFLWHCPSSHLDWPLASILPFGARTFLGGAVLRRSAATTHRTPARSAATIATARLPKRKRDPLWGPFASFVSARFRPRRSSCRPSRAFPASPPAWPLVRRLRASLS